MRRYRFPQTLAIAALALAPGGLAAHGMTGKTPKSELGASAAFTSDGTLVAVTKQGDHVLLYRSTDYGKHWAAPVVVNAAPEPIAADGQNRPKIVVLANGQILVSWTRPLSKPYSGEVRLARSTDGGVTFSAPITVHRDRAEITHRFETLITGADGRVYVTWIDKRDLEESKKNGRPYRGAAIYAAVSKDGGRSFAPEVKVADHSCECCQIAGARDNDGKPVIVWRHVFEPNERDHALAKLEPDGSAAGIERVTFDRWRVDACPHHGPALAIAADGTRHLVWFNQVKGEGRIQYGRLQQGRINGQRVIGSERAAYADIAVAGERVGIAWKEFDGERTVLKAELSEDGGSSFRPLLLGATAGASDQPRLLRHESGLFVFWRTQHEGMRVFSLR